MRIRRRDLLWHACLAGGAGLLRPSERGWADAGGPAGEPAYRKLHRQSRLRGRIQAAEAMLASCELCPRQCGADRLNSEIGFCRAPAQAVLYAAHPHYGEEQVLAGRGGSGTIFFSHCNLRCVFCQNWPISHEGHGDVVSDTVLADHMLRLQAIGCHNINLVTPTHFIPRILAAVGIAVDKGLRVALVYNTSWYERVEILRLLDGIVDIYLPDMKFMDAQNAEVYLAGAADYPEIAQQAVLEMQRQVGELQTDGDGLARKGLMIRHLVMPNRVAGTRRFVDWVARHLPVSTYVNIMAQYQVAFKAFEHPKIWRRITVAEYLEALEWAEKGGLTRLDPDNLRLKRIYRREMIR